MLLLSRRRPSFSQKWELITLVEKAQQHPAEWMISKLLFLRKERAMRMMVLHTRKVR